MEVGAWLDVSKYTDWTFELEVIVLTTTPAGVPTRDPPIIQDYNELILAL